MKRQPSTSYLVSLFILIAFSVALTETRHNLGQIIFIFGAYVISYFANKLILRPNLMGSIQKKATQMANLFFRGEQYEGMKDVEHEKLYLAQAGSLQRVIMSRWLTRGLFAFFVFILFSSQSSGKLVFSSASVFHLLIAATFLPIESLSHTLLTLGLNVILVVFYVSYNETAPKTLAILYFLSLFITLGLFGFSFIHKKFQTRSNLNHRLKSSLQAR